MSVGVIRTTQYAPGLTPLAELEEEVLSFVAVNPDSENRTHVRRILNRAIDKVNSRNWIHLTGTQNVTLVADQLEYDMSSRVRRPRTCTRLDSSDDRCGVIGYKPLVIMEREHQNTEQSGNPCYYSYREDTRKWMFNVPPSSTFVSQYPKMQMAFHARIPHLVYPTDVISAPPEFAAFVVARGKSQMAMQRSPRLHRHASVDEREAWFLLTGDDMDTQTDWDG